MWPNCIKSNGELLYISFNDASNVIKTLNQPDGVWCYDSSLGFLYHRYSLSNSLVTPNTIATASVNTTTNRITVTAAPVTGTEVIYNARGGAVIGGLQDGKRYFVIKIDATTVQLASTKTLAVAGTAIDLTGTGNASQILVFFPNIDYGQYYTDTTRAVFAIERTMDTPQYGTDVMWSGNIAERNLSQADYLGTVSPSVESRGYFITPKVYSTNVIDTFNLVTLKFSPFLSDTDKIIIKYRTYDDRRTTINTQDSASWRATWTSSTTFTTTQSDFSEAVVGNEVEFLEGAASGLLAHITAISENAGTYTVTIDETYDNYTAGDLSRVVFRNWIKWKTITYGDSNALQYYLSDQLGVTGKFIQMKIELRGIQVEIESLEIDNVYRLPSKGK
jgi:hypothetical protein